MKPSVYSTDDLVRSDPGRADAAIFLYDGSAYKLRGVAALDTDAVYLFSEASRIPSRSLFTLLAARYDDELGSFLQPEVMPDDSYQRFVTFKPPARTFGACYAPAGTYGLLRRRRSYVPFISSTSMSFYVPVVRGDPPLVGWVTESVSSSMIARTMLGLPPELSWAGMKQGLRDIGSPVRHPQTGTIFIMASEKQRLYAFKAPRGVALLGTAAVVGDGYSNIDMPCETFALLGK